jgi:hypothetical protein
MMGGLPQHFITPLRSPLQPGDARAIRLWAMLHRLLSLFLLLTLLYSKVYSDADIVCGGFPRKEQGYEGGGHLRLSRALHPGCGR